MKTEALKEEICRTAGRAVRTPTDFEWLSERVWERTRERLSPTTLKRFFGYLEEGVVARKATLDILARYVGYRDYEAFAAGDEEVQSNIVAAERLTAGQLAKGQTVRLMWKPDRVCVVEHLGQGLFEIMERENTKLEVGDIFECGLLLRNEPLYMNNVRRNGKLVIETYLVGRKDGVVFEVVQGRS